MADFTPAFDRTLAHEGGFVNDPKDRGGETFMGITRRDHPDWPGWRVVDAAKGTAQFPHGLNEMPALQEMASDLYKRRYWDRFDGDSLAHQGVAEELFDTGVNMGVGRAVQFLQRALNALNRGGSAWPDVGVDGDLGARTREAMAACLGRGDGDVLLKALNVLQGAFYLGLTERDDSQERFVRGWFSRVTISRG